MILAEIMTKMGVGVELKLRYRLLLKKIMGHGTKFWWGLELSEDMDNTEKKSYCKLEPSST